MRKRYLIIGSSASSNSVINSLIKLEPNSEIICITKDNNISYNTCYAADYLANLKKPEDIKLITTKSNNISFLYNTEVVKINPEDKNIILGDNQKIYFDKLFLGIGNTPRLGSSSLARGERIARDEPFTQFQDKFCRIAVDVPQLAAASLINIFRFNDFSDALNIKKYIEKNSVKKAIIVGGGLTGLECASSLNLLNIKISIIEKKNYLLSDFTNNNSYSWLRKKLEKIVDIYTQDYILDYKLNINLNKITSIKLASNKILETDLIIYAIGSKPNLDLIKQAQIKTNTDGIIVDNFFQTNFKDIYAAGDCISVKSKFEDKLIKSSTWPDAVIQGNFAAHNIVGDQKIYSGLLKTVVSNFFDIKFYFCGTISNNDNSLYEIESFDVDNYFLTVYNQDKMLTGFLLLGNNISLINQKIIFFRKNLMEQKILSEI